MRIGLGYDSHVFSDDPSRALFLGGVEIPSSPGLAAHSDGDVLIHAIIDALFGAAALGDIGSHFPDTAPEWEGADSSELLAAAMDEVREAGYELENLDATVICEKPRLRTYIDSIRESLADTMGVEISQISVKGKTNEKMDDVGAGKGIAVHAAVLLD